MHDEDVPLGSNADFSRCAMILNAHIFEILALSYKLTYDFFMNNTGRHAQRIIN